jgi:hypothetical protein
MFADFNALNEVYERITANRTWQEKLLNGILGDPNAPQLPIMEAGLGNGLKLIGSASSRWLGKGPKNTNVYLGIKGSKDVYVGITRQSINIRQAQHGSRFTLERITTYSLTRNQARAVEQALIRRNPQYLNKINSISPQRQVYNEAVKWGDDFLKNMGI